MTNYKVSMNNATFNSSSYSVETNQLPSEHVLASRCLAMDDFSC
jgi:hypothetical protein